MPADLSAGSRHEHLVLYDPAAIPSETPVDPDLDAQDPRLLPAPAMMQLASEGRALIVRIPGEDCEARFRLYVDEDPPDQIRNRGEAVVKGAHLRVPSGVVRADGLEFLCRPGESRRHAEPQEAAVPSGVYAVDVHSLIRWKLANRVAEGRRGIGRTHRIVHAVVFAYTWLGILMFPANIFVAPVVVLRNWRKGGWPDAAAAGAVILAIDAVVIAGFWLLQIARGRWPGVFRVIAADEAFEAAHPDIAVVLRTAEAGTSPATPGYAEIAVA
jgi:hypothetical protein